MFGYVRPLMPELKVKELERFRAVYCGMCHELGRSYGSAARFILNYDFVFLAMLLSRGKQSPDYEMRRCPVSPFCKKCVCAQSSVLTRAAGYSVILAYHQLNDSVRDEHYFKRFAAGFMRLALKRAYRRATRQYPDFDRLVRERLDELTAMEKRREPSLDRTADRFALLLAAASEGNGPEERVRSEMLYHLGRTIYIADAVEDLAEDYSAGRYNPLASRYGLTNGVLSEEVKAAVRAGLDHSADLMMADFALLEESYWTSILRNVIELGIPDMIDHVMAGTYTRQKGRVPKL